MLNQQETLALEMIFRGKDKLSCNILERIRNAKSIEGEETGVGFFSVIELNSPLDEVPEIRMYEYNFNHPNFPHGGSYMCVIVSKSELELEAVTLGGTHWPNPIGDNLFEEIR